MRRKYKTRPPKVHIPLNVLNFVSLPLGSYTSAAAPSGQVLVHRLEATGLPPNNWSLATDSNQCTSLYHVQCIQPQHSAVVTHSLIHPWDPAWTLTMCSIPISQSHLLAAPSMLICLEQVVDLLLTLDGYKPLCVGNADEKHACVTTYHHYGNLHDQSGKYQIHMYTYQEYYPLYCN